jgi:hypothetical protein
VRGAADLYWNSPFGPVCRWRAERYFLSYWLLFGEDLPDPAANAEGCWSSSTPKMRVWAATPRACRLAGAASGLAPYQAACSV